jgi:hypothetical protein
MEIEAYFDVETSVSVDGELVAAIDEKEAEEIRTIAEEMGLSRQLAFVSGGISTPTGVFPFREMTKQERIVYENLMASKDDIVNYAGSVIPLRGLQIAQVAGNPCYGPGLQVWHTGSPGEDPLLVGKRTHPERSWERQYFILARWGETLKPLKELTEEAIAKLVIKTKSDLETLIATATQTLSNLESTVRNKVVNDIGVSIPSVTL